MVGATRQPQPLKGDTKRRMSLRTGRAQHAAPLQRIAAFGAKHHVLVINKKTAYTNNVVAQFAMFKTFTIILAGYIKLVSITVAY